MTNCFVFFSRFGFVLLVAFVVHFNPEDLYAAEEQQRPREEKKALSANLNAIWCTFRMRDGVTPLIGCTSRSQQLEGINFKIDRVADLVSNLERQSLAWFWMRFFVWLFVRKRVNSKLVVVTGARVKWVSGDKEHSYVHNIRRPWWRTRARMLWFLGVMCEICNPDADFYSGLYGLAVYGRPVGRWRRFYCRHKNAADHQHRIPIVSGPNIIKPPVDSTPLRFRTDLYIARDKRTRWILLNTWRPFSVYISA